MKKLSIIVPVYNMEADDRLSWCLDSLVNQTLPKESYEIIAVDDASTDGSPALLNRYAQQYPGLVQAILSPKNHHQGGAKNLGLARAEGEWIGFIDADDWVTPDYYERLLERAEETGADMVGCDYHLTGEHSDRIGQIVPNNRPEQDGTLNHARHASLILDGGSLVVKIYRRSIVYGDLKTGVNTEGLPSVPVFPEDIFYEDNAVSNTWMLRATQFSYLREPLYYYYQHESSTVHTISRKNLEDRKTAGRLILSEAEKNGYRKAYAPELEFQFTAMFYINTLFSAMPRQQHVRGAYAFCRDLAREMKETFPQFEENVYYQQRIPQEERDLIHLQMKSHLMFYLKYRALWAYRDFRKWLRRS